MNSNNCRNCCVAVEMSVCSWLLCNPVVVTNHVACHRVYFIGLYQIRLFKIRPEPDLAGFKNSNPAGSRFGDNWFWDRWTIRLMKLMPFTMLSAAIKRKYSSVLPLYVTVCQFLTKFLEWRWILYFPNISQVTIVNTPLGRSAALVLSVVTLTYRSCTGIHQIRHEIWLETDVAGFPKKNGRIPDLPEPKSDTILVFYLSGQSYIIAHIWLYLLLTNRSLCVL